MTLHSITVSNLKCFNDLRIEFAPLTLLTGLNSAGKSTVLQAILLIAQNLKSDSTSSYLLLNGRFVRLGSAADLLSNRAKEREIRIAISDSIDQISWHFNLIGPQRGALEIKSVSHSVKGRKPRTWSRKLWKSSTRTAACDLIRSLTNAICVSAVRGGTSDVYPIPDDAGLSHADVGNEGQFAPWWYVNSADDEIDKARRYPGEPAASLRRQLDAYLGELFPGAEATADEIARTSLVRLALRPNTTSDWIRPANIGYGLSYAFPILVALLLSKRKQVIVIDSPEAHLHPSAQSRIGKMLARFASAGVQILVETHSDHLLNGVRLAVSQGLIKPQDVKFHFFSGVTDDGAHGVISPVIDEKGTIDSWPTGFFDQAELDVAVLTGWE